MRILTLFTCLAMAAGTGCSFNREGVPLVGGPPGDGGALPIGPFGAPTLIEGNFASLAELDVVESDPTLTSDRLEMYFNSNRDDDVNVLSIWVVARESASEAWGTPVKLQTISDATPNARKPAISPDGFTLWYDHDAQDGNGRDIYVSQRPSREMQDWSPPVRANDLSSPAADSPGGITADRSTMVLNSRRNRGDQDLFLATRSDSNGLWTLVSDDPLSSINRGGCTDTAPSLSEDGRILVYGSDQPGCEGRNDLHVAYRGSSDEPFIARDEYQAAFDAVNTEEFGENNPWLSPEGDYLVFSSNRDGPVRLYEALRVETQ